MAALLAVALLVLLPASDFAIACVQRVAVTLVPPKRLPRLDFSKGVPETARTMVIVPTMLTTASGVDLLLEHVEVLALGNSDPFIHFAILSDFADTSTSNAPSDDAILARARAGIEALNLKFGEGHADRFFLFHRDRQWNLGEHAWIGWERKRGKIEEFNRLLRGADGHQLFDPGRRAGRAADGPLLPHARLRHAPAARRGETPDRHHRAPAESGAGRSPARTRHGGLRDSPAARQRDDGERGRLAVRANLRRPHRRRPVHDRGLRRLPGSLRRRHLHGKRACTTSTRSRRRSRAACPRTPCSRTISSKACTRARPSSRISRSWTTTRPACSPTRGGSTAGSAATGRFCGGCFRSCRRARASRAIACRSSPGGRSSTTCAAACCRPRRCSCSCSAGRCCRGPPLAWTAIGLAALLFPCLAAVLSVLKGPRRQQSWRGFLHDAAEDLETDAARAGLQLTFVANEACDRLHAIAVTLVRLGVTRRQPARVGDDSREHGARRRRGGCAPS